MSRVVGREGELAQVARFLDAASEPSLVLSGSPGVGKSTVWDACVEAARARGFRVLAARAAEPEVRLSFVVLADLHADIELASVGLSRPVHRALDVAVLRAEPDGPPPDPLAVATGFLAVLRHVASSETAVVAIDDVAWLDPASSDVLCFAARRLRGLGTRFVLARRRGKPSELERSVEPFGVLGLELEGLSLGATRVLLAERLGLTLPRRVLVRLHDAAQGNPLFVLEMGRALVARGVPEIGADLPVPERVEDVFAERLGGLSPPIRRALLAVALNGALDRAELATFLEPGEMDDAVKSGLLVVEADRVHASHPLLAATVRNQASPGEREDIHLVLAERATGGEALRLRHRALAARSADGELAAALVTEATAAAARGAAHDAVELADHAFRLTPTDAPERHERLLSLAEYLELVGELPRLARLLEVNLGELDAAARARAHLLLAETAVTGEEQEGHLDLALAQSGNDRELRASVLAAKTFFAATIGIEQLDRAEGWAVEALRLADGAGPEVAQRAVHALAVTRVMRGRPIDDLVTPSDPASDIYGSSLELLVAIRLGFRGHAADARRLLRELLALAEARGEARSHAVVLQHLCRIELQAGRIDVAARLLEEIDGWETILGAQAEVWQAGLSALAAGVCGARGDAGRLAATAVVVAAENGARGDQLDAQVVRGLVSLLNGDAVAAAGHHRVVWEHMEREGVDEPAVYPVAPDFVEALVVLGELEEATAVVNRLERLSIEQSHPWGLATTLRCRGLLQSEVSALAEAVSSYEELELHFDAARSLLALGRVERRLRRWGAARTTLERAVAAFEQIGATGWADGARSELGRIGGRARRASGELTPTEQRIVELAVGGLSNKEIAARLVVSVYTVERHLSHVYAKLGIRSRTQLAPRLGDRV